MQEPASKRERPPAVAVAIHQQRVFGPFFTAIDGAGAGGLAAPKSPHLSRIDDRGLGVQFVLLLQHRQQQPMQAVPNTGPFPTLEPGACRFSTAAHLLGHIVPATTGDQHKPNYLQHRVVIDRPPSPLRARLLLRGQQREGQVIHFLGHTSVRHDSSPCESDKGSVIGGRKSHAAMSAAQSRFFGSLLAYPTVLASYAVRQIRAGRQMGSRQNVRDALSSYSQRRKGFAVQPLFDRDAHGEWEELTEDRKANPADVAACRIDFRNWLSRLKRFKRQVALRLARGDSTSEAARYFRLSRARISQLRQELRASWNEFQAVPAAA